jgi:hypothetical protein
MRARRALRERLVAGLFVFVWEAVSVLVAIAVAVGLSALVLSVV